MAEFNVDALTLPEQGRALRALQKMRKAGAPFEQWPEHEVIHIVPCIPGGRQWFYCNTSAHPSGQGFLRQVFIPPNKNGLPIAEQEWAESFAHEMGHVDDWFCVDALMERRIMDIRKYPRNQLWTGKPPWYKFYMDVPNEWYAECFSVAFYPHHARKWKKWREWAAAVRAIRGTA